MEENSKETEVQSIPDFKLSTIFPYFLPFIISLGVFRLMIFYNEFGIRITSFLDFSEVIISFMDILIILLLVAALNVINSKLHYSKQDYEKYKKLYDDIHAEKSEWRKFKMVFKIYFPLLIFYAVAAIVLFIYSLFIHVPIYVFIYFGIVAGAALILSLVRIEVDIWHKEFNSSQGHKEFTSVLLNALMYVVIVFATARIEANMLKESSHRRRFEITLEGNKELSSTNDFYLVGKTANYIFLYSATEQRTEVIPAARVSRIEFYGRE